VAEEARRGSERIPEEVPDHEIYLTREEGPWSAKSLSLEGTLNLINLLGDVIDDLRPLMDERESLKIGTFLKALGKTNLLQFLSLAVQQPPEWVEKNFDFPKALKAIRDFWELNRLGEILGLLGWRGLGERGKGESAQEPKV